MASIFVLVLETNWKPDFFFFLTSPSSLCAEPFVPVEAKKKKKNSIKKLLSLQKVFKLNQVETRFGACRLK